jgi:hypothetical protein
MAITSIKTGSSFKNLIKYNDFLAGNTAFQPTAYESIATVTVGSGGTSTITFSRTGSTNDALKMSFNSATTNYYGGHFLYGTGAAAGSFADSTSSTMYGGYVSTADSIASSFAAGIIDILDYANTNKNKTVRLISGIENNGTGGYLNFSSSLWMQTTAVNSITLTANSATNLQQYSKFGLFGIKGA